MKIGNDISIGNIQAVGDGAVTPADLANLVRWNKADGALYTDAAGSDLVDTNLDPIGNATDESGVSNPVVQATSASKPTWLSADPSMSFDGGDLLTDALTDQAVLSMTICVVFEFSADSTHVVCQNSTSTASYWSMRQDAVRVVFYTKAAGVAKTSVFNDMSLALNTKGIMFVAINSAAKTVEAYKYAGGTLTKDILTSDMTNAFSENLTRFTLGAAGQTGNPVASFQGKLYENFQTSDVMSVEDMEAQGAALAAKWGVS